MVKKLIKKHIIVQTGFVSDNDDCMRICILLTIHEDGCCALTITATHWTSLLYTKYLYIHPSGNVDVLDEYINNEYEV